jgi:hypothetical protein
MKTRRLIASRTATQLAAVLVLIAAASGFAPVADAQTPDFEGYWWPARGAGGARMPELTSHFPEDGVALRDLGTPSRTGGDFGELSVKPAALAEAMQWDPMDEETVSRVCKPPSIIYGMPGPFPFEIYQGRDLMVFRLEYYDQTRVVFMDGRPHPGPDYPHTTVGHSIAHWEDDVLVIDTTHLAASTIMANGLRHSDEVHLVERYRLTPDGRYLHFTQVIEDPLVLNNRGVRYVVFERQEGYIFPYDCDPAYGQSVQQREGQSAP